MPRSSCNIAPDAGASASAVLIATVRGRDTGVSVLTHLLNALPGYQIRNVAAGVGWVHLSEFAQRWLAIHQKATDRSSAEYIHFSQFIARTDDIFKPDTMDTDFRGLRELLRRGIKPAWYNMYNVSKVLCGLRHIVLETHNPNRRRVFGFTHAFDARSEQDWGSSAHMDYATAQAVHSLHLFLMLFPRGRIIVHLPSPELPDRKQPPRCVCPGSAVSCRVASSSVWPDGRLSMLHELRHFAHTRSQRVLLTSASEDFNDMHGFAARLTAFLREPMVPGVDREAAKSALRWSSAVRHDDLLDARLDGDNDLSRAGNTWSPGVCRELSMQVGTKHLPWCPPFRCRNASRAGSWSGSCITCPATLADWAWARSTARTAVPVPAGREIPSQGVMRRQKAKQAELSNRIRRHQQALEQTH